MFDAKQIFKHGYPTYFLVTIIGKDYIFFPKIWCYPQTKNEREYFSKKKYTEIWYLLQIFWKYGLFKKDCAGTWNFFTFWKGGIFFPENMVFFPWTKNEREVIFLKKYTETWHFLIDMPPCKKKKIKDDPIPQKYTQRSLAF